MDELEQIRQKKLSELQQHQNIQHQISMIEASVKQLMDKEAVTRYGNIKAADPEKAIAVLGMLAQVMQSRKLEKIGDETLKRVLLMLSQKKDIKITRR